MIFLDGTKVQSIVIRHGSYIDRLQFQYSDGSSTTHGGGGGSQDQIDLEPDEYLTEISGTYGDYVDSLLIRTNVQTFGPYGGNGGTRSYRYQVPEENMEIIGLFGAAGNYMDAMGIIGRQRPM